MEKEDTHSGATDETVHTSSNLEIVANGEEAVMRTGCSMADRVEHLFGGTSGGDRYVATKLPIYDPGGIVVGFTWIIRQQFSGGIGQGKVPRLQRVVDHVRAHYKTRIRIAELAGVAHLSQRQLNRWFQEDFGMSIYSFIVQVRINAAIDDLLNTEKRVAQIAVGNGFYDQSSFTRTFRLNLGSTPMAFRRTFRCGTVKPGRMPRVRDTQMTRVRPNDSHVSAS